MEAPGAGSPLHATGFELTVSVSHDARLAAAVRDLARYAAQAAGCDQAVAESFGRQVEDVVRHSIADRTGTGMIPVTLRCRQRLLEVDVDGRTLTLDAQC